MTVKQIIKKYKGLPVQMRASFWFLICAFTQKGISVMVTPIFTRLMTTNEYGDFSVFISWMSIIAVFVSMNLYSGVYSQGLIKFEDRRSEYASSLQGLSLTLTLAWTVLYCFTRDFWNKIFSLNTIQMLCMFFLIWTTSVYNFWAMGQRVDFKYTKLVIVTLLASVFTPVLGIIGIFSFGDTVMARIGSMVAVSLFGYVWMFFSQIKKGRLFFSKEFWKYAFFFNLPLIPHYLSLTVLNGADRIMIERICGSGEAGIYNLAYSISQIMTIFNTALLQTIEPWLYIKIKEKSLDDISRLAYPAFVIIALMNLFLILFAPEVVRLFAPEAYYHAIYIIPPVAMSVFFMFAYTFFSVFEFYYEKTNYIMSATLIGAVLNIILNYIFINIFGYQAAGYTTLACYILYALFHYYFMNKICMKKFDGMKVYNTKVILGISITFLAMGFICILTYRNMYVRYGTAFVITIILIMKRNKIKEIVTEFLQIRKKR